MFHKILIPLDGSQAAERALDYLGNLHAEEILLASLYSLPLEGSPDASPNRTESLNYLQSVREKLASVLTVNVVCGDGEPAGAILEIAESAGCDLILMTSHGRTGFKRFLLGSVAEKVARYATCPVLLVGRQVAGSPQNEVVQTALDTEKYFAQGCS